MDAPLNARSSAGLWLAALLAAVLGLCGYWLFTRPASEPAGVARAGDRPSVVSEERASSKLVTPEQDQPGRNRSASAASGGQARSLPVTPERVAPSNEPADDARFTFRGALMRPDREQLVARGVHAQLIAQGSTQPPIEGFWEETKVLAFPNVRAGRYTLRVEAEGYTHLPQTFDLKADWQHGRDGRMLRDTVANERVYLWPASWVALQVRTPDGRPFTAISDALDLEPRRFFVGAFEAAASLHPISAGMRLADLHAEEVAVYHPPKGYQNVLLAESTAGSLEILEKGPIWVALWVHDAFHSSQLVQPGQRTVEFELDLAALEERFATLTFRVIDQQGQPVLGATSTLKADISAHRRDDLSDLAPDATGHITFARVIPGQHELTVETEGAMLQRRVELATAEARDLGDLVLRGDAPIPVTVVDANGDRVHAAIRVAPYEPGRSAHELYPPNRHRWSEPDEPYLLPVPDVRSIVCAEPQGDPENSSANHLIDPSDPPRELEIRVLDPPAVRFEPQTPWDPTHALQLVDELGIIAAVVRGETAQDLQAKLFPGRYDVRRVDADGLARGSRSADVTTETRVLDAP